jgi:hypothetical protein
MKRELKEDSTGLGVYPARRRHVPQAHVPRRQLREGVVHRSHLHRRPGCRRCSGPVEGPDAHIDSDPTLPTSGPITNDTARGESSDCPRRLQLERHVHRRNNSRGQGVWNSDLRSRSCAACHNLSLPTQHRPSINGGEGEHSLRRKCAKAGAKG